MCSTPERYPNSTSSFGAMGIMTTPYQVGCKSGVSPKHPMFNSVYTLIQKSPKMYLKYLYIISDVMQLSLRKLSTHKQLMDAVITTVCSCIRHKTFYERHHIYSVHNNTIEVRLYGYKLKPDVKHSYIMYSSSL